MQLTIVSGTPEELTQFFNDKQGEKSMKEMSPVMPASFLCKRRGDELEIIQREYGESMERKLKKIWGTEDDDPRV